MKIFLDTNIWLRFIVADDDKQFLACEKLIQSIKEGRFRTYTSNIVLLEVNYVLNSFYKIEKEEVINVIDKIIKTRNLTLIEESNFLEAVELYKKTGIKLSDCIIFTQAKNSVDIFCTYDKDFNKFDNLKVNTPQEILKL